MRIALPMLLAALAAIAQDTKREPLVDVGKVLRESKEFAAKCKEFKVTWSEGVVRSEGQVYYRGGGPCEYLVGVFPAKAHETIVLLDKGPFEGEGRRPREPIYGLAEVINNAFLAAGFQKGKPFDWDRETGDVFAPKGETTYVYCEWKSEKGKVLRARMCDWLWNFKLLEVMQPGKIVYTGSLILDEGPPTNKKWLGAEVDGLVVAILNTSTALMDNVEDGGLDNGAYEAIPIRIPPAGTRVTVAFSKKELEVTENYPPLKLPKELQEEKRKSAEEAARKKLDEPKKEEGEKD
ncbi:MAG: YdjY domain-containing protein [Planctomycetota bacterium]|jgi:hypothetical protein